MNDEKIKVRVTATGQTLDVVVLNKRVEAIEIVLGEGVHSVRCRLTPTRNGTAYVGNAMGREIVYERDREHVQPIWNGSMRLQPASNGADRRRVAVPVGDGVSCLREQECGAPEIYRSVSYRGTE